ncbi:hypothetical protein BMS3Bbin04_02117 [bacterium BMS3Bbin04]|nr:hypothetical protein BMS3Bbin04_02117 [bacterium BMS3Bbin04]
MNTVCLGTSMPIVDRSIVLYTRITRLPGVLGNRIQQFVSIMSGDWIMRREHRTSVERLTIDESVHELIIDTNTVVRVLEIHRGIGFAIEAGVIPLGDERLCLALLLGLALDKFDYVRMIDVEDDHLGSATGLTARFDHPGKRIIATHETHRSGSLTAMGHTLIRST